MKEVDKFMKDDTDRLLHVPELAYRLGTSQGFVRELIQYKVLESIGSGRYRRVRKVIFNKFLEKIDGEDIIEILAQAKKNADRTVAI
jgi:excisionase family DNA binding protein